MNPIRCFAALALALTAAAAPATAELVPVPRFKQIELRGGGQVVIRHGATQQVRLVKGSRTYSHIGIETERGGKTDRLVIEPCRRNCPRNFEFEVEIVTPDVHAVSVKGGGEIRTLGSFPAPESLALAVNGGGQIDARSVQAVSVAAAINGGGVILTRPKTALTAAVKGGGEIRYWGKPSVVQAVSGGGTVVKAGRP